MPTIWTKGYRPIKGGLHDPYRAISSGLECPLAGQLAAGLPLRRLRGDVPARRPRNGERLRTRPAGRLCPNGLDRGPGSPFPFAIARKSLQTRLAFGRRQARLRFRNVPGPSMASLRWSVGALAVRGRAVADHEEVAFRVRSAPPWRRRPAGGHRVRSLRRTGGLAGRAPARTFDGAAADQRLEEAELGPLGLRGIGPADEQARWSGGHRQPAYPARGGVCTVSGAPSGTDQQIVGDEVKIRLPRAFCEQRWRRVPAA